MKVRTKIGLLLLLVVGAFVAGLCFVKMYDQRAFRKIAAIRADERQYSFEQFLEHWSKPLRTFADFFSGWDGMVAAIETGDQRWADGNVTEATLVSYRVHAAWVYAPDGKLLFKRNLLYSDKIDGVPLPPGTMETLLARAPRCHFFAETPHGLMEIEGRTVHPSADAARTSPLRGYLFAGRLWSKKDLEEISLFTGDGISLAAENGAAPASRTGGVASVNFQRPLPGWDGRPIAALQVRNDSPAVEQLNRSSRWLFMGLVAFAFCLLGTLIFSLTAWVSSPLHALSKALKSQDPARLQPLHAQGDEFGELSRMMADFFEQREKLLHEMGERRQAEAALHDSEERLRHSQKMEAIGRLAGGVAHDFNNLLTAIIGYSDMIIERRPDGRTADEARVIKHAGTQAAELTRQLLAFSRKQVLHPQVLDLAALVREMEKLLRRVIGEKITLRVEVPAEPLRVNADPAQLEQVLLNLAVNARDAMWHGGTLTMQTSCSVIAAPLVHASGTLPPGKYVTLTVQDTGCGMDEETLGRIFEPFFTTKDQGKGTGLGLATVYGIVNQSGGAIVVASQRGVGTTFTVHLPYAEEALASRAVPSPAAPAVVHDTTVLVVEDEALVRELIFTVLSANGYTVLTAAECTEAVQLAALHRGKIDLIICDVVLPHRSGPEVARELLAIHPRARLLYISGYSESEMSEDGSLSPAGDLLEKPFTPESVSRRVHEVLSAEPPAVPAHLEPALEG